MFFGKQSALCPQVCSHFLHGIQPESSVEMLWQLFQFVMKSPLWVAKGSFHSPPPPQTHFPLHWPWGANKVQMLKCNTLFSNTISANQNWRSGFFESWLEFLSSVKQPLKAKEPRLHPEARVGVSHGPHPHRMSIVSWEWRLPRDPLLLMRRHIPPVWVEFLGQNVAAGPSNSVSEHAWKRLAFSRAK